MPDIFDIDALLAQLVLALGAALFFGNGYALWMDSKGKHPQNAQGPIRRGRALWLLVVGAVIAVWGLASLVT